MSSLRTSASDEPIEAERPLGRAVERHPRRHAVAARGNVEGRARVLQHAVLNDRQHLAHEQNI
jgi:hypothetical protein